MFDTSFPFLAAVARCWDDGVFFFLLFFGFSPFRPIFIASIVNALCSRGSCANRLVVERAPVRPFFLGLGCCGPWPMVVVARAQHSGSGNKALGSVAYPFGWDEWVLLVVVSSLRQAPDELM